MSIKAAYFDCAFGAAGDMLVGACIDSGVPHQYIDAELKKLQLPGEDFTTTAGFVHRASIYATKFDVWVDQRTEGQSLSDVHHEHGHAPDHEHEHEHDHQHNYSVSHFKSHSHSHSHSHEHRHPHADGDKPDGGEARFAFDKPERSLADIIKVISQSALCDAVKKLALDIFENLGRAEAAVHGVPIEQIHFHEVGAVDAICDIVGFAIAYNKLGIDQAYVSPVPLGSGTVETRHGCFPVPGPATLAMLKQAGARTSPMALAYECLTPTGAAILTTIGGQFGAPPAFEKIESVGYGAGTLNPGTHPNVVRLIVGQCPAEVAADSVRGVLQAAEDGVAGACQAEVVAVVEANVDDMAPHMMAYAMEKILQAGALDVSLTPIVMKKGRLAQKLSVIARPADRQMINALILSETSTIGTRSYYCERLTLNRDFQEVTIGDGPKIRLKLARDSSGRVINIQPEYEDCREFARHNQVPLKEVLIKCLSKANEILESREKP